MERPEPSSEELRRIPSVDALVNAMASDDRGLPGGRVARRGRVRTIRTVVDSVRERVLAGEPCPDHDELVALVHKIEREAARQELQRVINATGIVLHTNLGRAPLAPEALDLSRHLLTGYCNLELDLESGERGKRANGLSTMLSNLTGAELAAVVNNGAAAVLLALQALAAPGDVLVSRGELVQIGGGFRVPDILNTSGARLVEVGTTNITQLTDYERVVTPNVKLILRVHRSNFVLTGHVDEPPIDELATLARRHQIPFVYDLGSGDLSRNGTNAVASAVEAGVDLVTFSGDKLIGGPQAGILAGRAELVERCRKHPLYRALRIGRLTTATLQETLRLYLTDRRSALPTWQMLEERPERLAHRAAAFLDELKQAGIPARTDTGVGATGGGANPERGLETTLIVLEPDKHSFLAFFTKKLRDWRTPIMTRVDRNRVLIDLRTVSVDDQAELFQGICAAWEAASLT